MGNAEGEGSEERDYDGAQRWTTSDQARSARGDRPGCQASPGRSLSRTPDTPDPAHTYRHRQHDRSRKAALTAIRPASAVKAAAVGSLRHVVHDARICLRSDKSTRGPLRLLIATIQALSPRCIMNIRTCIATTPILRGRPRTPSAPREGNPSLCSTDAAQRASLQRRAAPTGSEQQQGSWGMLQGSGLTSRSR